MDGWMDGWMDYLSPDETLGFFENPNLDVYRDI